MSDSEPLVAVEGLSKIFCRDFKRSLWYGLQDGLREFVPRSSGESGRTQLRAKEFWANQDISFELRRGQCLGLIGHNGAGKTTLLKLLSGLVKPDRGSVRIRGRVGSLIALGTGFNPVLTGRENVFVAGSVAGLTRSEIREKFDSIVEFADVAEFIDSPVQNYSSGMQVRLGFAVATAMEPDVLLIDEVLAVGDAEFRNRCYNRLGNLREKAAVVFVSHNMNHVATVCDSCLHLEGGRTEGVLPVEEAIAAYQESLKPESDPERKGFSDVQRPLRRGEVSLDRQSIGFGETIHLTLSLDSEIDVSETTLRVVFSTPDGRPVMDWWSIRGAGVFTLKKGENKITVKLGPIHLRSGLYLLNVVLSDRSGLKALMRSANVEQVEVKGADAGCQVQLPIGEVSCFSLGDSLSE